MARTCRSCSASAASGPVRAGVAASGGLAEEPPGPGRERAWLQRQLDVYGELLEPAQRLVDQLGQLDPVTRQFPAAAADTAAGWRQQDQGIWEICGEPRYFLYSKLMRWVAVDRAIALAGHLGAENRVGDWQAARDEIRAAILTGGWKVAAFTLAFGSDDL